MARIQLDDAAFQTDGYGVGPIVGTKLRQNIRPAKFTDFYRERTAECSDFWRVLAVQKLPSFKSPSALLSRGNTIKTRAFLVT